MRFSLGVFVGVFKAARGRCWMVNIGTKYNHIADMACRLELHKAEEAKREVGSHNDLA